MLPEIPHDPLVKPHVYDGLRDHMCKTWKDHEVIWTTCSKQRLGQFDRMREIDVVVRCAMNEHQRTSQISRVRWGCTSLVTLCVFLRQSHVSFGVMSVIVQPVGYRRSRHPAV